ncbi:MAG: hypothetical protein M1834_000625 [Cirrosporium novae-zelandiae]|nr:MAG: hypothetical protein M1834_000625 [Cirrosporium novae-zelandiae]
MTLTKVLSISQVLRPIRKMTSAAGSHSTPLRDSSWADGLRGLASLGVVSSHLVLCFALFLIPPATEGGTHIFQRPFFRLIVQGTAWVAIFFILMGFVNSLKPVKQSRAAQTDAALAALANSSFRRTSRLVMPATAATLLSWTLCQLGAYSVAQQADAYWMRSTAPLPSPSFSAAVIDFFKAILSTWTDAENPYDQPQWALLYLFKGSVLIFMTLLATINTTPKWRVFAEIGLYSWSWYMGDCLVGMNVYAGMILAELSMNPITVKPPKELDIFTIPLAIIGLFLCSFPTEYADTSNWSSFLMWLGMFIFPAGGDQGRFWSGIGAQLLCLAVLFSPTLKRLLTHPFLMWLGASSFPIYLLHGPLVRSLLAWMTFGVGAMNFHPQPPPPTPEGEEPPPPQYIPMPPGWTLCVILPAFAIALLSLCHVWTMRIEPLFGKATKRFEDICYGKYDKQQQQPVLPRHKD